MTTRYGRKQESGSIFLALFGAVAMLGLASAGLNMMMRGPLTTMANVNKKTVSENSMVAAARLAVVMAPTAQGNAGDCDSDGYVEPVPYRDAGAGAKPSGGGYIPATLGAQTADAWKTEMGYCAWDPGSLSVSDNVAACGGSSAKRLKGAPNNSQYAVAVISAGPDKTFQTACNAYVDANTDGRPDTPLVNTPAGSDDMVMGYTYAEATKVGGGGEMWTIKSGAPGTAAIGKNIEVSGSATLSGSLTLGGGLVLPGDPGNNSVTGACNASNDQKLRRNTSINPPFLEICNFAGGGNAWEKVKILDSAKSVPNDTCNTLGETRIGRQCYYDDDNYNPQEIHCDATPPVSQNTGQPYDIYDLGWLGAVCDGTYWAPIFGYSGNGEVTFPYHRTAENVTTNGVTDKQYVDKAIKDTGLPTCALNEWVIKTETGYGCFCGNPNGSLGWAARPSAGERSWTDVAVSSDGSRMAATFSHVEGQNIGDVMISTDYGRSWSQRVPSTGVRNWETVAMSADGLKIAVGNGYGYIHTSVDGGITWTERTASGQRFWANIASSADGTRLVAAVLGNGYLYTSSDSGATWTERTSPGFRSWGAIASSSDGLKLAAAAGNGQIYISADGGATWTARGPSQSWFGIASSSDGTKLAAVVSSGGYVYTSTDSGTTWMQRTGSGARNWIDITSSADGTKLAATTYSGGSIYTSTDSGVTWTQQTGAGARDWYKIASSADGTKIIAYDQQRYIYTYGAGCSLTSCTGPGGASVPNGGAMAAYLTPSVPYGDACIGETRLCSNGALGGSMENASCIGSFAKFSPGSSHTCALTINGAAWCWGSNADNKLGTDTGGTKLIPTVVSGAHVFSEIVAAGNYSCALKKDGSAWCWGGNGAGQLGDGTTVAKPMPNAVSGAHKFKAIVAYNHSCALKEDGSAWCWGGNNLGQSGDGTTVAKSVPTAVSGGHSFISISIGSIHTCALKGDGSAWCWGYNGNSELGDGTTANRSVPTAVTGGHIFTSIESGAAHNCALKGDGSAWCWGNNIDGKLGDGTTTNRSAPVAVSGGHIFVKIMAGSNLSCGLKADGSAWCWGNNSSGRLGDGTTTNSSVPVAVTGGHQFVSIDAGFEHICALKSSGALYCWGIGSQGQLGIDTTATRSVPTLIYQP